MNKKILALLLIGCSVLFCGCTVVTPSSTNNGTNIKYDNESAYHIGDTTIDDDIENIEIHFVAGNINVVQQSDKIELSETANKELKEDQRCRSLVADKTLIIQYCKAGTVDFEDVNKELTISLPSGLKLKKLTANVVSTDLKLAPVEIESLTFDSVSGDIYTSNATEYSNVKINTVSGNAQLIGNIADTLNFNTTSGDLTFDGTIINKVDFDSVSGNMTLNLPAEIGFAVESSTVSGDISADRGNVKNDLILYGDEKLEVDVDTVSGDLTIKTL